MSAATPGSPSTVRAGLCLTITVSGLALRGFGLGAGLPVFIVKYGGSMLWATMVFFLVAMAAPNLTRPRAALIAAMIAVGVELFRLVHAPWLDAFRLTLPGALLLGRIFSAWDMLAYGAGIILGMWLDRLVMPCSARPAKSRRPRDGIGAIRLAARLWAIQDFLRFPLRVVLPAFALAAGGISATVG